ncbi:MAG: CPBP family glutamic-type intramembrane protease [Pseudobdellovibrionaceae bacterium]
MCSKKQAQKFQNSTVAAKSIWSRNKYVDERCLAACHLALLQTFQVCYVSTMYLKFLIHCAVIIVGGFTFEWIFSQLFGLPGTSYGRWAFYGLLAIYLIWRFDLDLGFRPPIWSRMTIAISTLFVVSPILYWLIIKEFSLPLPNWERTPVTFLVFAVWCPIFEELVFRQSLQQYWKKLGVPILPVFFFVSLFFALYHPGFILTGEMLGLVDHNELIPVAYREFLLFQIPDTFIAGVLFSALRETSRSTLWVSDSIWPSRFRR